MNRQEIEQVALLGIGTLGLPRAVAAADHLDVGYYREVIAPRASAFPHVRWRYFNKPSRSAAAGAAFATKRHAHGCRGLQHQAI